MGSSQNGIVHIKATHAHNIVDWFVASSFINFLYLSFTWSVYLTIRGEPFVLSRSQWKSGTIITRKPAGCFKMSILFVFEFLLAKFYCQFGMHYFIKTVHFLTKILEIEWWLGSNETRSEGFYWHCRQDLT